jgi:Fe-S cluster assembly protein SufD
LYKGAVKDQGHSIYQGVINAKPGAIRVDAYQMNNNLILNEEARADSLPGLEIDADDLKCSHGATMGTLDPDQLFYLRARGLSDLEARRLLVAGFFEEVIAKIPYAFVQDRLRDHIVAKMALGAA